MNVTENHVTVGIFSRENKMTKITFRDDLLHVPDRFSLEGKRGSTFVILETNILYKLYP